MQFSAWQAPFEASTLQPQTKIVRDSQSIIPKTSKVSLSGAVHAFKGLTKRVRSVSNGPRKLVTRSTSAPKQSFYKSLYIGETSDPLGSTLGCKAIVPASAFLARSLSAQELTQTVARQELEKIPGVHLTYKSRDIDYGSHPLHRHSPVIFNKILEHPCKKTRDALFILSKVLLSHELGVASHNAVLLYAIKLASKPEVFLDPAVPINSTKCEMNHPRYARIYPELGKLIYLADNDLESLQKKLCNLSHEQVTAWIHERFNIKMNHLCTALLKTYSRCERSGLHDPDLLMNVQLPAHLSKIIITGSGQVNHAILPSLSEIFLDNSNTPQDSHNRNLEAGIALLSESLELRKAIEHIHAPIESMSPGADLVRLSEGLSFHQTPSNANARRAALTALLTHLRQDPKTGSCFVSRLTIQLLRDQPLQCLKDMRQLIHQGHLTRSVKEVRSDLPFLLTIPATFERETVTINAKGRIQQEKGRGTLLWKSPAVLAAAKLLGVHKPSKILRPFCELEAQSGKASLSAEAIVKELLRAADVEDTRRHQAYRLAAIAYSELLSNPLQKAWESAIAGLAQNKQHIVVLQAILETLSESFLNASETGQYQASLQPFLREQLIKKMRIPFDPNYQLERRSSVDERSVQGAFVLHEIPENLKECWIRRDTPVLFKKFISNVCTQAIARWSEQLNVPKKTRDALLKNLNNLLNADSLIQEILNKYRLEQNLEAVPIGSHEKLYFTPWLNRAGGDAKKLTSLYFGSNYHMRSLKLSGHSATELTARLIFESQRHLLKEIRNQGGLAVRIVGLHAFTPSISLLNRIPNRASLQEIQTWLEKEVILPGRRVADSPASADFLRLLSMLCLQCLVPAKHRSVFLKKLRKWNVGMSIKQVRQSLLKAIQTTVYKKIPLNPSLPIQLDTLIAQSLPTDLLQELTDSALPIADSNWADGKDDIDFCFVVNPGTGTPEIWEMTQTSRRLTALDQELWVRSRPWELFCPELNSDVNLDMRIRG